MFKSSPRGVSHYTQIVISLSLPSYIYIYTSRIINSIYHPRHYPSILEYPIHIFNINIQQSDYEYPITYPVTSPCILLSYLIISHHILSYLIISHHISSHLIISHYISLHLIIYHYIWIYHHVSLCLIVSHCILSWLDIPLYHIYIIFNIPHQSSSYIPWLIPHPMVPQHIFQVDATPAPSRRGRKPSTLQHLSWSVPWKTPPKRVIFHGETMGNQ